MEIPFMPLSGTIRGTCVDPPNTRVRENLFRITKKLGYTQIDILAAVPPETTISRGKLHRELFKGYKQGYESHGFIEKYFRRTLGFEEDKPRLALASTYVLNQQNKLIFEELSLVHAVCTIFSTEEYSILEQAHLDNRALWNLLQTKITLRKQVTEHLLSEKSKIKTLAEENVFIANQLFNNTCRRSAISVGIPFIKGEMNWSTGTMKFLLRSPVAKFNCALRRPCDFINMSIIVDYLTNHPQLFTLHYLRSRLPLITDTKKLQ